MKLDFTSIDNALESLRGAIEFASDEKAMHRLSESQRNVVRAGAIQNFEFTYELCVAFIRRWLKENAGEKSVTGSRRDLYRSAAEYKLIQDVDKWMTYHVARNETSHTYNQDKAAEIFDIAKKFEKDAKELVHALKQRND